MQIFEQAGAVLIPLLFDSALKATVILAIAGLATALLARKSAALRHLVWTGSVVGSLLIPFATVLLPSWTLPGVQLQNYMPDNGAQGDVGVQAIVSQPKEIAVEQSVVSPGPIAVEVMPAANVADAPARQPNILSLILAIWLGGVTLAIAPFLIGLVRVKWIARSARPLASGVWIQSAGAIPATARPSRHVRYLESSETAMPMAFGIATGAVLLPAGAERWPEWQRRNVLVHELAHIRRNDCLTQLFAEVLRAVYWFNPLAWVAASRMRAEREIACDDAVLSAGSEPADYAGHLLEVARSMRPPRGIANAAIAMARPSQLSGRLLAVLDSSRSHAAVSRATTVGFSLSAVIVALLIAAFSFTGEALAREAPRALRDRPVVVVPAPAVPLSRSITTASLVHADPAPVPAIVCNPGNDGSVSISQNKQNDDSDRIDVRYTAGDCTLEMNVRGRVALNRDLSDIATLSPGGSFFLEERNGRMRRRIEIRATNAGLVRRFLVNGRESQPSDGDRAWLAEALRAVERRTAFSAKPRVRDMFDGGGYTAVLDEIGVMQNSYARRTYMLAMLAVGINPDARTLNRLIELTAPLNSDYDRSSVLVAIAPQRFMDDRAWRSYAAATRGVKSDYERRRMLLAAFDAPNLSLSSARDLLEAASLTKSDYELRTILSGSASRFAVPNETRPAFMAAVATIQSDYEKRQVLAAASIPASSSASAAALLGSARTMASDYEKSEAILGYAQRGRTTPEVLGSMLETARTIKADYEKRRALEGIIRMNDLSTAAVGEILHVSRSIGSDYELRTFLETVLRIRRTNVPHDAFDSAAATIGSGHELNELRRTMQSVGYSR